jgi:hypothetical protein
MHHCLSTFTACHSPWWENPHLDFFFLPWASVACLAQCQYRAPCVMHTIGITALVPCTVPVQPCPVGITAHHSVPSTRALPCPVGITAHHIVPSTRALPCPVGITAQHSVPCTVPCRHHCLSALHSASTTVPCRHHCPSQLAISVPPICITALGVLALASLQASLPNTTCHVPGH